MRGAVTLIVDLAFAVVFARALVVYLRKRDRLQGAVVLVFSAMAVIFVLEIWRRIAGPPPAWLGVASTVLLLAQPYLTLRLVAQLRPVPAWLRRGALGGLLVTAAPVVAGGQLSVPAVLAMVALFVGVEAVAAGYLFAEARRRTGSPRVRLVAVAAATAAFAVALLAAGAGAASGRTHQVGLNLALALALASAVGYLIAFAPPLWLRRSWSASAAYAVTRRLLHDPPGETPEQTWQHYANTICAVTGADATVVLLDRSDDEVREVAFAGGAADPGARHPAVALGELLTAPRPITVCPVAAPGRWWRRSRSVLARELADRVPGLARDLAGRVEARYVTAVPLGQAVGGRGALVLLSRHRRLFSDDDVALLGELGEQAGILADRGSLLNEKERLNVELAGSVEGLSMASKAKSDFLAAMSHELRTPLNAIIGFADLMEATDPVGDDERLVPGEWVRHVRSGGTHLLDLINDILDLAKVEAGRIDLRPEQLKLPLVVAEVVTTLRVVADRKQVRITTEVPAMSVLADRIRLRQVLDNLLSNAIKFTPPDGGIHVSAACTAAEVRITVADTGVGIAPDDQKKVFEEFTQVGDPAARQAGTGLGLALTRRLVEAHGGRVELESEPGSGSRFTICLPGSADQEEPAPVPMVAEADSGRILVVEDDCAAAGLLRTYLNDLGYRVTVATSGGQGLAYALEHRPAAILLDVLLPDTDGWHVLRELKRQPATRDIPVIISTVLDQNEVGVALGAVDYLVKPVEPDALVTLLRRHALRPAPAGCESVLAIDDDPATLDLVAATLARHGVRTETAATGHAGLELARRGHHDLIICDLRLPDIDGFTIVATLRDQPDTANIPIVVLTAGDLSEQDTARLAGGVVDIVTKGERARERLSEWLVRLGATSHGEVASPAVGAGTGAEGGRAGATAPLVSVVVAPAVASTVAAVGGERE